MKMIPESASDVQQLFKMYEREPFSWEACQIIYNMYDEENQWCNNLQQFDVIAWDSEWAEEEPSYIADKYGIKLEEVPKYLSYNTIFFETSDGYFYREF